MSKEDHPAFYGKDKSNLPKEPKQPKLFEFLNEANELIRMTNQELEQVHIDLKFLDIMVREFGR